ncbi:MAG TPA: hypothetical protein VFS64_03515 [Solirubrobacterales bacterium]|nr:hypothetical protein [Solirubrobacterales bacterium]
MKQLKMLGLAAVAAMALMAILGAGTASATTQLQINTTPSANDNLGVGTRILSTVEASTSTTFSDPSGVENDTCPESTIEGEIEDNSGSGDPTGLISALTLERCTEPTRVIRKGSLEIQHIAGTTNGTVISSGAEITVFSTVLGADCFLRTGTGTSLGTLTGAGHGLTNGTTDINATIQVFGCGITNARWKGRYEVTSPTGLTVE